MTSILHLFSYLCSMIRTLITPKTNDIHIEIPDEYLGKKVEVLVFAYDEPSKKAKSSKRAKVTPNIMEKYWGVVSKETAEKMHQHIEQSRNEWERDI